MAKERPGVLLYFSIRPCLKRLSVEDKGALFEGILDYAQHGIWPDFDGTLGVAWDFIVPLIDADAEAYKSKCEQAKRAVETRWARQKEDTDVYACMRTNTKGTNNNINSTSNPNDNINITINSTGGDSKGEPDIVMDVKPMPDIKPMNEMDFEEQRRIKLEQFNAWPG